MKAIFKGGSKDGDTEELKGFQGHFENHIVRYVGPDQNPDGSWTPHPSGDYDNWYVPAEIEVYKYTGREDGAMVFTFSNIR